MFSWSIILDKYMLCDNEETQKVCLLCTGLQWNVPTLGKDHRMHMVSFPSLDPAFHHSVTILTAFVFEICTCLNLGTKTLQSSMNFDAFKGWWLFTSEFSSFPVYLSLCLNTVFYTTNKQKLSRNLHGIEHTLHISEWLNNWLIADEQVELYMLTQFCSSCKDHIGFPCKQSEWRNSSSVTSTFTGHSQGSEGECMVRHITCVHSECGDWDGESLIAVVVV